MFVLCLRWARPLSQGVSRLHWLLAGSKALRLLGHSLFLLFIFSFLDQTDLALWASSCPRPRHSCPCRLRPGLCPSSAGCVVQGREHETRCRLLSLQSCLAPVITTHSITQFSGEKQLTPTQKVVCSALWWSITGTYSAHSTCTPCCDPVVVFPVITGMFLHGTKW